MKVSRSDEEQRVWFRSERVFYAGRDEWYFQTREGVEVGPYESQFEAEIEAGMLKELLKDCRDEAGVRLIMRDFVLDSFAMGRPLNPRFREHAKAAATATV